MSAVLKVCAGLSGAKNVAGKSWRCISYALNYIKDESSVLSNISEVWCKEYNNEWTQKGAQKESRFDKSFKWYMLYS